LPLAACGNDSAPTFAEDVWVDVTVLVDWPLVREEGFVDARWELTETKYPEYLHRRVKRGVFPPDGMVTLHYTGWCDDNEERVVNYNIWARGHFTVNEHLGPDPGPTTPGYTCTMHAQARCTSESQVVVMLETDSYRRDLCTPPGDMP
jgi:hypothetical protein